MAEGGEDSSQGVGAEAAPDMALIFQAMARQFITAITDLRREAPRKEERGCPFKRFERLHTPLFDGKRDPIECENWLTDVEEILRFWWNGMKQDIAKFVERCSTCQQVKAEHQRPAGLLQPLEIPVWKWEAIAMDFLVGLP
jgi:hypothetical protein